MTSTRTTTTITTSPNSTYLFPIASFGRRAARAFDHDQNHSPYHVHEIGNSPTSRSVIRDCIAIWMSTLRWRDWSMVRVILYSSRSRLRRSRTIARGPTDRPSVTASSRHAGGGIFTRPLISTFPSVTIGGQRVSHSLTHILHGYQMRRTRLGLAKLNLGNGSEGWPCRRCSRQDQDERRAKRHPAMSKHQAESELTRAGATHPNRRFLGWTGPLVPARQHKSGSRTGDHRTASNPCSDGLDVR